MWPDFAGCFLHDRTGIDRAARRAGIGPKIIAVIRDAAAVKASIRPSGLTSSGRGESPAEIMRTSAALPARAMTIEGFSDQSHGTRKHVPFGLLGLQLPAALRRQAVVFCAFSPALRGGEAPDRANPSPPGECLLNFFVFRRSRARGLFPLQLCPPPVVTTRLFR